MAAEGFFYLPQDEILPRAMTPRTLAGTVLRRIRQGCGIRMLPMPAEACATTVDDLGPPAEARQHHPFRWEYLGGSS